MEILKELQAWYEAQCNGEWEHQYGVTIDSLDNPGWWVKIDLVETTLEEKLFASIKKEFSETNWIQCYVEDKKFNGAGDPSKLETILRIFLEWSKQ